MHGVDSTSKRALSSLRPIKLKRNHMEIHVYDTYVKAKDGHTMHFDVFTAVKDDKKAIEYAKQWLTSIGEGDAAVHWMSGSRKARRFIFSFTTAPPILPVRTATSHLQLTGGSRRHLITISLTRCYPRSAAIFPTNGIAAPLFAVLVLAWKALSSKSGITSLNMTSVGAMVQ